MSVFKFNVRVYGLLLQQGQILLTEEQVEGIQVTKFPGGGLEYGEGTIDCLKREFKEELGIDIHVDSHFYTTDFFQPSAFGDSQVLSIYYKVSTPQPLANIQNLLAGESSFWMPIQDIYEGSLTLPIDRMVGKMIHEEWAQHR